MARLIRKLEQLDTRGVALVSRGANRKRIAITKAEDSEMDKLLLELIEKGELADEAAIEKLCKEVGLDDAATAAVKAVAKIAQAHKDQGAAGKLMKSYLGKLFKADASAEDDEDGDEDDVEKKAAMKKAKAEKAAKEKEEAEKAATKKEEAAVAKSVEAVEAVVKSQEKVIEALQKGLKDESDKRKLGEWIAKAEKDCAHVPDTTPEKIAKEIFDLEVVNEAMAKSHFDRLKSVSASVKANLVQKGYSPNGISTSVTGGDDAFQAIMKAAEPLVTTELKKSHDSDAGGPLQLMHVAKTAEYQAVSDAIMRNPELYARYLDMRSEQDPQHDPAGNRFKGRQAA